MIQRDEKVYIKICIQMLIETNLQTHKSEQKNDPSGHNREENYGASMH